MTIGPTNSAGLRAALAQVGTGKTYDTLHMTAGTYDIDNSVTKGSGSYPAVIGVNNGSTVYGDMDANGTPLVIWKLMDDAPTNLFACQCPMLGPVSTPGTDIEIYGIEFDGNAYPEGLGTQTPMKNANACEGANPAAGVGKEHGKGYHNILGDASRGFKHCKFHNLYIRDNAGDGIRVFASSSDVEVNNITITNCGHTAIMFSNTSDLIIHDGTVTTRVTGAIRLQTCNNVTIKNFHTIGTSLNYGPGWQIERVCKNIDISECYFHDIYGAGITIVCNGSTGIHVHHSIFERCGIYPASSNQSGVGGIITTGATLLINNNVFYACRGYGVGVTTDQNGSQYTGTGYVITVENNIFMNTAAAYTPGTGSGSAIANLLNTAHTVNQSYNCFYGNVANLKNVATDVNSVLLDPAFINAPSSDFHLKSTHGRYSSGSWVLDSVDSPCIDKGDPSSDYSLETVGNGQRINIGRYGGTAEASRTTIPSEDPNDPEPPNPPSSGGTRYVAQVTGYDYFCDPAATDHQTQINAAGLAVSQSSNYNVICLIGSDDQTDPVVYTISDKVWCYSKTRITAEGHVVVKLKANAGWAALIPMFMQATSNDIHDFEMDGFEIDGNEVNQTGISYAADYYNLIYLRNVNTVKVHDMVLHDCKNDAIRLRTGTICEVYNNVVYNSGNNGIDVIEVNYANVHDNTVTTRISHGIRVLDSNNFKVNSNTVKGYDGTDAGLAGIAVINQGSKVMDVGEISGNIIESTYGPGIALANFGSGSAVLANAANWKVNKNIIKGCGLRDDILYCGGIVMSGIHNITIEGNDIDSCLRYGIAAMNWTTAPSGTGYTSLIRNNNIVNTIIGGSSPAGTGIGVANLVSSSHIMTIKYNCFFNNVFDLGSCTATNSVTSDPLFADAEAYDYHLKSTHGRYSGGSWILDEVDSPCIDAGDPASSVGAEPDGNGGKINIGRWGGTAEASKTTGGSTGGGEEPEEPGGPDPTDPPIDSLGTEVLDGRTVVFAEYVPETTLGMIPANPVMRAFQGDITKIVISSGAEFDEFDILKPPTTSDRLNCGVAVRTVEKMSTVEIHMKPSGLSMLPYAACSADTVSYTSPGTSMHPVSIGVRCGPKYTVIKGCVLQDISFKIKDTRSVAECVLKFNGIERTPWAITDYIGSTGSHSTPSGAAPFKLSSLSNVLYDGGAVTAMGFIVDSLSFGFKNSIKPILSISGIPESKIVGWSYGPMEVPLTLGATLTDPALQDSCSNGNAHTLSFILGGKTFNFTSIKWANTADFDADPGSYIGMELEAAPKAIRVAFA